jgi:catechol 2,3-dioxygenase-like lactoylglutathione lyase family enzyme
MQQTMSALASSTLAGVLACTDIVKERDFFADTLGMEVHMVQGMPGYAVVHTARGAILCYERHQQPPCEATAEAFIVDDLAKAMGELRAKGVHFEEYDRPGLVTENGVAMQGDSKGAWFKDPAGNILALTELGPESKRMFRSIGAVAGG